MKVSREQVAENRRNILDAAARLFKERGFDAVTVVEVMKAAGLTHGGFYGYFRSKDDLVTQACIHAIEAIQTTKPQSLQDYSSRYLSSRHRNNRAGGCPFAALGSEVSRQSAETQHELTQGLRLTIEQLSKAAPGETADARRAAAIASFSAMLGGIILARIVDDPVFSEEILVANRKALGAVPENE
ncbi:TetR/AcrR family transcriptional regulator [Pseudomonas sp. X10]